MIVIDKIIRPLKLVDYAPEYEGQELGVQVNPTTAWIDKYVKARTGGDGETVVHMLSEVLFEGGEPIGFDTLKQIFDQAADVDPMLVIFIRNSVETMIGQFRGSVKKA